MGSKDPGLPASLKAAWGVRDSDEKRQGLSLSKVVRAGVEVADADGLSAVSMARVGEVLGTTAMSLYRYVKAKDELLILMIDEAYGPPPRITSEHWRKGLEQWAYSQRDVLRRHPWILAVPVAGPPITPHQIAWLDCGLRSLRDTDLDWTERLSALMLITGLVRNEVLQNPGKPTVKEATDARNAYGETLQNLIDPYHLPELAALLESGALAGRDHPDAEFDFGLSRVLDGIDRLITAQRK